MKTRANKTNKTNSLFETLEVRQLMTFLPTDMTQLAQVNAPHAGTTNLYLNFDGGTLNDTQAGGNVTVSPFAAQPGQDRNKAIADIIYRVSEMYAPFNVAVHRTFGAGTYATDSGDSTVFIGAQAGDTQTVAGSTVKVIAGFTQAASSDYPGSNKGITHTLNSDAYDIGFVDPVAQVGGTTYTVQSDAQIASAIGHESGHTFGLVHVLASPTNEIMSYNSANSYFANQAFPVTTLNYNAATGATTPTTSLQPTTMGNITFSFGTLPFPSNITTQNSYTYLMATLGSRASSLTNFYPWHVADPTTVDPSDVVDQTAGLTLTEGSHTVGILSAGVGNAYTLSNSTAHAETEIVRLVAGVRANPEMIVYDSTGATMKNEVHGKVIGVTIPANSNMKLVVSGYDGFGVGSYNLSVYHAALSTTASSPVINPILNANPFNTANRITIDGAPFTSLHDLIK